jgi:hypothetical protein
MLQRYTSEPLFKGELRALAEHRSLHVVDLPGPRHTPTSVLGPAARGLSELVALQRWIPDIAEREVFLYAPSTLTDGMERLLAAGLPSDRIHTKALGGEPMRCIVIWLASTVTVVVQDFIAGHTQKHLHTNDIDGQ